MGLNVQVPFVGRPAQPLVLEKLIVKPEDGFTGVTVNVTVDDCPAGIELGTRVPAVMVNGDSAEANLLTSTEPRPVTRLYPVVASAFETLNPTTPEPGHSTLAGNPAGVFGLQ